MMGVGHSNAAGQANELAAERTTSSTRLHLLMHRPALHLTVTDGHLSKTHEAIQYSCRAQCNQYRVPHSTASSSGTSVVCMT